MHPGPGSENGGRHATRWGSPTCPRKIVSSTTKCAEFCARRMLLAHLTSFCACFQALRMDLGHGMIQNPAAEVTEVVEYLVTCEKTLASLYTLADCLISWQASTIRWHRFLPNPEGNA